MTDLDKEIEEKLEQKIDEKIRQLDSESSDIDREKLKNEILEEIDDRGDTGKKNILENLGEKTFTRREFLKTLGLGAGGLALSSSAAGVWATWQASSQGNSDIDADTVDGNHASDLGGLTGSDFVKKTASTNAELFEDYTHQMNTDINTTFSGSNLMARMGWYSNDDQGYVYYSTISYSTSGGDVTRVRGNLGLKSLSDFATPYMYLYVWGIQN